MNEIKKPFTSGESKDSAEMLFCKSIAADLEKLSQKREFMVKNEIRSVVFKHQMAECDESAASASFQQSLTPLHCPVFHLHDNPPYSVANQNYIRTPPRDDNAIFKIQFGGKIMYNMPNNGV